MAYEGPEVLVGLDFLKQFRARINCGKGLIEFDGIGQDNGWKYPRLEEGLVRGTALEKGEDEMSEEELRQVIPTQWHQYLELFKVERARKLPPRRECDHEIELTPGAELKRGPIYQLDEHVSRLRVDCGCKVLPWVLKGFSLWLVELDDCLRY
ncbi:hypothetical protein TREMEDRAFT_59648 [Tremella mesenterica DSM 1558]|uniref:uncharacterized protein n=1 Tax=Tremella mesenterica (strain ATCC 24925 / CBS 8224 / DSM 1558 / NBRC 9311 / NRRL Y-6157 / RJB 2259-6 / UBC 559-6) TaxID=578456 RepID=UPI0003F49932|nr:uncharacterized protein TREMEDRAFT_59648 [Tremella mesenterica DSM 1558]EIW73476.1 hypothetical protein TREMEDRAFT_59648 [Tremella mesenterica DSM 1558]